MTKHSYLREVEIRFRKKRVNDDAPVNEPLTDSKMIVELFRDMQNDTKEKMVAIAVDNLMKIIAF